MPMRPAPTTPRVFSHISRPEGRSCLPALMELFIKVTFRAQSSIRATARSATESPLAPGVMVTWMPFSVAAATSTLS